MYVIDASVHVADMRRGEPHHDAARAFLRRVNVQNLPVYLPTVVLPEIASTISRGTGQPVLAQRLVALIESTPHFEIVPVDSELGRLAADLAARHAIRGCDAVYVALAEQRRATLITLDQQQRARVPSTLSARSPAEELSRLRSESP